MTGVEVILLVLLFVVLSIVFWELFLWGNRGTKW